MVVTFLRTRNIRLLIYLDDILIVGSDIKTLKEQTGQVLDLLQKPGFHNKLRKICADSFSCHGISRTSSRLQNYDVLSTVTQGDKNNRTMQGSTSKQNCLAARACPVTGVSRIDTASCMAGSAAFQTSSILSDTTARSKQGFLRRHLVSLQLLAKSELQWWISNIHRVNDRLIQPPSCEMTITSDASKLGWGAACGLQTTKGSWSSQERSFHINILELKAAFLAIQSFLKHKTNISIKLIWPRLPSVPAITRPTKGSHTYICEKLVFMHGHAGRHAP